VLVVSSEIESERKSMKNKFSEIRQQTDQAEKTIVHDQDEIMAALISTQGLICHQQ
jgi:hypothetical protein